jgi:FlaA1/EpsC-like NDP-sugar epimerase
MISRYIGRIFFNRSAAFFHDALCIPAALFLALWLRFNLGEIPAQHLAATEKLFLIALPIQALMFWIFGFYRGFWRFASIPDLMRIMKAVTLGSLGSFLIGFEFLHIAMIPRSVIVLYPLLLALLLCGSRFIYRYIKDRHLYMKNKTGKRALIIGAGRAGDSLVRDILSSEIFQPMGFLDDDPKKQGRELHGVRVLGSFAEMIPIAKQLSVQTMLLAIPSADRQIIQQIVNTCAKAHLECKTLPSITELTGQKIEVGHLRDISVDDLLGREPINLDTQAIAGYLGGKSVLITGGGGSIGSELCRQVARAKPSRLIIFEQSELNIYNMERELQMKFPDLRLEAVLGDVKNKIRVDWVCKTFAPEVIFHAAAYKHVPMVEKNPSEGICNNIMGTRIVADAADRFNVKRFVLVSTDKAVNPANVMGTTKRVAELYCQNLAARSKTKFITTRFGNVLGSTGSVVPLFKEQIKSGGPVTVTHSEITRFFMTIPEAVGLILQAGSMGNGGEIYVLDMGEPVLIKDLAAQMIRLSGQQVDRDIKIVYTGLRPGEKLYEEVFHANEPLVGTEHPKLQLAHSRTVDWLELLENLDELQLAAQGRDVQQMLNYLKNIVPEFTGGTLAYDHGRTAPAPPAGLDTPDEKLRLVG